MKFQRKKMVDWYNLRELSHTAIKAVFSSIIGEYADKREMQAALGRDELEYDHSLIKEADPESIPQSRDEIWVDYVADLGDGFNSTYTIAHSLAQPELEVGEHKLPQSNILVMGGDEVYPAPVGQAYTNRLRGPYEAAFPASREENNRPKAYLFAIPGNHDWYDGLAQFIKLFCQKRTIGNWQTQQKRSYFAIKLLDNCWLWGIDVQLSADIDTPQLEYFESVAGKMNTGDHVILCTAEPAWVYHSLSDEDQSLEKLSFFTDRYIRKNDFNLVATITGDLHHYAHYEIESAHAGSNGHLITSGGGGSFMHPTHNLKERIEVPGKFNATLVAAFPSKRTSSKLVYRNFLFPLLNWGNLSFSVFLFGTVYLLTAWLLQSVTEGQDGVSYLETLSVIPINFQNIPTVFQFTFDVLLYAPSVVIINLLFAAGILYFTDTKSRKGKLKINWIVGLMHAFIQIAAMYSLAWVYSRINLSDKYLNLESIRGIHHLLLSVAELLIAGILIGGIIFGSYLMITNRFLSMHDNEAFSSLKWQHHKNFLRIRIRKDKVTIFPVGINKVVEDWRNIGTEDLPQFEGSPVKYHLIDGRPIEITLQK